MKKKRNWMKLKWSKKKQECGKKEKWGMNYYYFSKQYPRKQPMYLRLIKPSKTESSLAGRADFVGATVVECLPCSFPGPVLVFSRQGGLREIDLSSQANPAWFGYQKRSWEVQVASMILPTSPIEF